MARVPSVTNISKDTSTPEHRSIEIDAGVLDVDAEIPDDFDWDALPDDDEPMPYSDEDDPHPPPSQPQDPKLPNPKKEKPRENGHTTPPSRPSKPPASPPKNHSRPAGVVADPMGVDGLEDGEIDQKRFKRRKKRKAPAERLHCEICDIFVTGQVTMDAHLKGQRHVTKAAQAEIRAKNKKISEELRAAAARRKQTPREQRRSEDEWDSSNSPPKPSSSRPSAQGSSAENTDAAGRTEVTSEPRDRYAKDNHDGKKEIRSQVRAPYARQDHDRRTEASPEIRDPYATSNRDRATKLVSDIRDPYATDDLDHGTEPSRDPRKATQDVRPSLQHSDAQGDVPGSKERGADLRAARDPYATGKVQKANEQSIPRDSSKDQNASQSKDQMASQSKDQMASQSKDQMASQSKDPIVSQSKDRKGGPPMQTDAADPKKRKRSDGIIDPGSAQEDRQPANGDRDRLRSYESVGDGSLRRRLSDAARDPGQRDPYVGRDSPRQAGPQPPKSVPPPLVSAPAPPPSDTREGRRPAEQTRRFTYGSVRRENADDGSTVIPHEWLAQSMDTNEWRDLRHNIFTKGDDVDKLAFKMLQEILLSPVLGVASSSLASFSRGMLAAVKNQLLSSDNEAFARFDDFPEPLSVRDENYANADPQWQNTQTPEQMAVQLVADNIYFFLNPYEDRDAAQTTEPHNFPRRGSFGQKNMTKSSRDGGVSPRYEDSVELDALFNQLYEHLLRQNLYDR